MGIGAAFGKDCDLERLPSWDELMRQHPDRLDKSDG